MRLRTVAVFAAGVVVAASGSAFATTKMASIVGPDNKINGCYLTSAGLLRVVPAGTACRDGESAIAWSATGSGERGPAGPAGVAGPVGPKGAPGARWRSVWSAASSYEAGDLVRHNGSVWIHRSGIFTCLVGQNCVTPGTSPFWERFAQDGARGPEGVAGPRGVAGPTGPAGPAGPKGDRGVAGPAGGVSGYEIVHVTSSKGAFKSYSLKPTCPAGKVAVGGGFSSPVGVNTSRPLQWGFEGGYGRGWHVSGNTGAYDSDATAYAICVAG